MFMFPEPIDYNEEGASIGAFIWLYTELSAFLATIISNVLFLALRTCLHHKV
jgi:hypothetical protein